MKPFTEFLNKDESFWANIKLISETIGYSDRESGELKRYNIEGVIASFQKRGISHDHVYQNLTITSLGKEILFYLNKRSKIIEEEIQPNLMDRDEARKEFEAIREHTKSTWHEKN